MLPDTFFAIEGDKEAVEVLQSVVVTLGGRPLRMGSGSKALYHAAASAASNFVVGLMDYAVELMTPSAGIEPDLALPALLPLVRGTLANLDTVGLPDALTRSPSPEACRMIDWHLRALATLPPAADALYPRDGATSCSRHRRYPDGGLLQGHRQLLPTLTCSRRPEAAARDPGQQRCRFSSSSGAVSRAARPWRSFPAIATSRTGPTGRAPRRRRTC
ncbi:MAG: DUF2520 domain-containing protein [Planctomycetota bacterium]